LETTYSLHFKAFKALDTDGPATRAAFKNGSIDVGLVFSSDGDLNSLGLVVLQDDKHLENADNVVPIVRQAAASDEVKTVLNAIDAKLTTADLVTMNSQVSIQHQDADAVAGPGCSSTTSRADRAVDRTRRSPTSTERAPSGSPSSRRSRTPPSGI